MLERQQSQLIAALEEMYRRMQMAQAWTGPALRELDGRPLTHEMLAALNVLEIDEQSSEGSSWVSDSDQPFQMDFLPDFNNHVQENNSLDFNSTAKTPSVTEMKDLVPLTWTDTAFFDQHSVPAFPNGAQWIQQPRHSSPSELLRLNSVPNDPLLYQAEWVVEI